MKRSSKNSPPKPQLLSNSFLEVLQRWSSIFLVPPTGFRINVNIVLPGFSKGGGRRIPCLPFWSHTRSSCLCSFGLFSLLKKKDTSRYYRLPVHQGKGQFCSEKHHRRLDEMLAKSERHFLKVKSGREEVAENGCSSNSIEKLRSHTRKQSLLLQIRSYQEDVI